MRKGQGSLEYLIIIAAVLSISAIIVLFLTGFFQGQSEAAMFAQCKQAATSCRSAKLLTPNDPCTICEDQCVDFHGNDLIAGIPTCVEGSACWFCKQGRPGEIYDRTLDLYPPSQVTGLGAAFLRGNLYLFWDNATDDIGVVGYAIYRNDTLRGTSTENSYIDIFVGYGKTYSYKVSAYDTAGRYGLNSSELVVTTPTSEPPGGIAIRFPPDFIPPPDWEDRPR